MKKSLKNLLVSLMVLVFTISLIGCSGDSTDNDQADESTVIKIGCTEPSKPRVDWLAEGLNPLGYQVEAILFDDNNLPATALKDGDLDGIMQNQLVWINSFNKNNNSNLQMVEPYSYYSRNALYSAKHTSVDQIPDNAQIAIPNDPANMERALVVLRDLGFITFGDKVGEFYSMVDIQENPQNIEIIETERVKTVRSINDVDAIFATADEMKKADLDPSVFLYEEPNAKNYPHGLVVDGKDIDAQWVKDAMTVIESAEYKTKFNDHFAGTHILFND